MKRPISKRHWQDWATLAAGIWLILSPQVLGLAQTSPEPVAGFPAAIWNFIIIGVIVAGLAGFELFAFRDWEEWIGAALGTWLIVSPWALGFNETLPATVNAVASGLVIATLSGWTAIEVYRGGHA
ncbi:SPW repeat protein [Leisingera sp.]|uniref:SPW repeat protein n=1 Tax=Leisingera sp. TaxID=1879318 RepID=UPI002B26EEF4|nr:SPW repeat protein [Leisingera sp.]